MLQKRHGRLIDVLGDDLHSSCGLSVEQPSRNLRALELGLHPLEVLVSAGSSAKSLLLVAHDTQGRLWFLAASQNMHQEAGDPADGQ